MSFPLLPLSPSPSFFFFLYIVLLFEFFDFHDMLAWVVSWQRGALKRGQYYEKSTTFWVSLFPKLCLRVLVYAAYVQYFQIRHSHVSSTNCGGQTEPNWLYLLIRLLCCVSYQYTLTRF